MQFDKSQKQVYLLVYLFRTKLLSRENVPSKYWDTSNMEIFDIKDLPCQEKIQEKNILRTEFEKILGDALTLHTSTF